MNKLKLLAGLFLVLSLVLAGCEGLPFEIPWLGAETPEPTISTEVPVEETSTLEPTTTADETPQPVTELTVWVPPEMDPESGTETGSLFARQLTLFSEEHDSIEIHVRVKAASGASGLLDSLTATSAAAPSALPDLIALSRPDLEMAALKGLIYPLDNLTKIPDDTDWYPFAQEMALLQGSTFGLPFSGDSLVLVYRPTNVPDFTGQFSDLTESGTVLTFPAGSDLSLYTLALYKSEGGQVQDNQRRPKLDIDPLTNVYRMLQEGVSAGVFPINLADFKSDEQVWEAFRDGQTDMVVTWVSNFLEDVPADSRMVPLFPITENLISIGTGMSWAVAASESNRQQLAVELAEFLVSPEFLSDWSMAAGNMPPRPSALEEWSDQGLRATISQIALTTELRPSNAIVSSIGPIFREGTLMILQDMMDPAQAALIGVESLED